MFFIYKYGLCVINTSYQANMFDILSFISNLLLINVSYFSI